MCAGRLVVGGFERGESAGRERKGAGVLARRAWLRVTHPSRQRENTCARVKASSRGSHCLGLSACSARWNSVFSLFLFSRSTNKAEPSSRAMHESPEDGRGSFRGCFIVGRNGERSLAVTRKYFFERATCTGTTVVKDRDAFVIKAACAFARDPRNADIKSPTLKNVRSKRVSKRARFIISFNYPAGADFAPAQWRAINARRKGILLLPSSDKRQLVPIPRNYTSDSAIPRLSRNRERLAVTRRANPSTSRSCTCNDACTCSFVDAPREYKPGATGCDGNPAAGLAGVRNRFCTRGGKPLVAARRRSR